MNKLKVEKNNIQYPIPLGIIEDGYTYYVDGSYDCFSNEYFKNNVYLKEEEDKLVILTLESTIDDDTITFEERPIIQIVKNTSNNKTDLILNILDEKYLSDTFDIVEFIQENLYKQSLLLSNYNKYLFEKFIYKLLKTSYFSEEVDEYIKKNGIGYDGKFFTKILEIYLNNQEHLLEFIFKMRLFDSFKELLKNKMTLPNFIIKKDKQKVCYSLLLLIKEKLGIEVLKEINKISNNSNNEIKLIENFFRKLFDVIENNEYISNIKIGKSIDLLFESFSYTKQVKETLDYFVQQLFSKYWIVELNDFFVYYLDYLKISSYINDLEEEGYSYSYYPKDIKIAHDETNTLYMELTKDSTYTYEQLKNFKNATTQYMNLEYSNEKYSIIVPPTIQSVADEGENLNHCVKSYTYAILDKSTQILFLRKNEEKNKSYLTLEVRKNRIFQAKKYDNEKPNDEDKAFINEWAEIKGLNIYRF